MKAVIIIWALVLIVGVGVLVIINRDIDDMAHAAQYQPGTSTLTVSDHPSTLFPQTVNPQKVMTAW